jgi:hypothetical protein
MKVRVIRVESENRKRLPTLRLSIVSALSYEIFF